MAVAPQDLLAPVSRPALSSRAALAPRSAAVRIVWAQEPGTTVTARTQWLRRIDEQLIEEKRGRHAPDAKSGGNAGGRMRAQRDAGRERLPGEVDADEVDAQKCQRAH
jgi:hypothetical protein